MIVAIDYDNTYTADPETWNKVIHLFLTTKHTVICVTGRDNTEAMSSPVMSSVGRLIPVIFAGTSWKRVAAEKAGYKVDIWIDDTPESIAQQYILLGPNG